MYQSPLSRASRFAKIRFPVRSFAPHSFSSITNHGATVLAAVWSNPKPPLALHIPGGIRRHESGLRRSSLHLSPSPLHRKFAILIEIGSFGAPFMEAPPAPWQQVL